MAASPFLHKIPDFCNYLSTEILAREAMLAGFSIFKLDYFDEKENGYFSVHESENITLRVLFVLRNIFN